MLPRAVTRCLDPVLTRSPHAGTAQTVRRCRSIWGVCQPLYRVVKSFRRSTKADTADSARWRARPVLSRALSAAIFLAPLAVSVGVASLVASTVPHPRGVASSVLWWAAVLGGSTLALYGAE